MKGDFTRFTFKKENHFRDVRMQQGRVQLDADWNEQQDITNHRVETGSVDVIGGCGAPIHHGGFHLVTKIGDLTPEEKGRPENESPPALAPKGDFYISGGRYYSNGILCENDRITAFTKQPDLPDTTPVKQKGIYLAYLDVWTRHITALEAPHIREVALGGPDTTTRAKTLWQVKLFRVGDPGMKVHCLKELTAWDDEISPGNGKLAARAEKSAIPTTLCDLAAGSGYRRLENQLYRVEVHTGGARGKATFKWSRDNGSIVTRWEKQDTNQLTVSSPGRDKVLNFASGQWIELTDDTLELLGRPGTLVKLEKTEGPVLTIDPATATGPVDLASFPENPKVRRWDLKEKGVLKPTNSKWVDLEDGVQVKFSAGTYRTGDYWLIPARTAASHTEAGIEWPEDENTHKPRLQSPHGIQHHFCRLAIMEHDGAKWSAVSDCRKLFPPVTELTSLFYVGGDGQETMPGMVLPQPLQVGVSNGKWPVSGTAIKFTRQGAGGALKPGASRVLSSSDAEMVVLTDSSGIAECRWQLGEDPENPSQQVEAVLLDTPAQSSHLPVRFTANLSVARRVFYDPKACTSLEGINNLQDAIDRLCRMTPTRGCAVTVGEGGNFETLQEAFASLDGERNISICLLPGLHDLEENLVVEDKNSLKITGCGAGSTIRQNSQGIFFSSNQILLLDLGLSVTNDGGQVMLSGNRIAAERCTFQRTVGSEGIGPLLSIRALSSGTTLTRWKNNTMRASWTESIPQKAVDYLMPVTDVALSEASRKRLIKLSGINPHADRPAFETSLKSVTRDIIGLSAQIRASWSEKRPVRRIQALPSQPKAALKGFYATMMKARISEKALAERIEETMRAFYVFHYSEALALERRVGGWIEDNEIDGYLILHRGGKYRSIRWDKTTPEQQKNKQTFADNNAYLVVDPVSLQIRGNHLYTVHSNGYSIMQVMASIINEGHWPHELPEEGYESVTVSDNVFRAGGSSFAAQSLSLDGNSFPGGTGAENAPAAFVLGYAAVFMGNIAPSQDIVIETILKSGWRRDAANLIEIV